MLQPRLGEFCVRIDKEAAARLVCAAFIAVLLVIWSTKRESASVYQEIHEDINSQPKKEVTEVRFEHMLWKHFFSRLGNDSGPIIVGGIGDSGTRGVREVLIAFNVDMLAYPYVSSRSCDSRLFSSPYEVALANGQKANLKAGSIYQQAIAASHSLKYNITNVSRDLWSIGSQFSAKMLAATYRAATENRRGVLGRWGFKHPRSALLLPLFIENLKDKFVFVHVLRDGKDVIEGDNQNFYLGLCATYYGRPCQNVRKQRAEFWADLNRDIFEMVLLSNMKANQYIAIRSEDIVLGNRRCLERLAHYVGISTTSDIKALVDNAVDLSLGHELSYFGSHWSEDERLDILEIFANRTTKGKLALEWWGYRSENFTLGLDCESLPWLDVIRKKKGALPGDAAITSTAHVESRQAPYEVLLRQEDWRKAQGRTQREPGKPWFRKGDDDDEGDELDDGGETP